MAQIGLDSGWVWYSLDLIWLWNLSKLDLYCVGFYSSWFGVSLVRFGLDLLSGIWDYLLLFNSWFHLGLIWVLDSIWFEAWFGSRLVWFRLSLIKFRTENDQFIDIFGSKGLFVKNPEGRIGNYWNLGGLFDKMIGRGTN